MNIKKGLFELTELSIYKFASVMKRPYIVV